MGLLEDRIIELLEVAVKKYGSRAALSRESGISEANLSNWLLRKKSPTLSEISKAIDLLECSILLPEEMPDYVEVPKYSARAGAGSSLITEKDVEGYYAFRRQFMARMRISEKGAALLDVLGDSMSPLLKNGDTILVDQSKTDPMDGQIFLIGLGDELLVKRLHRHAHGWMLVSVNPEYPPVTLDRVDSENLRVYGRVMWFGRVLA